MILPCSFRCRRESGPSRAWESLRWPPNFSLKMRQRLDGGPPRDRVPLSIPVTLVPGEIFHQSVALPFLRTQQVASPDSSSPRAGSHAGIGVIWNVGQPLVAWPEADADGPTRSWSQGEAETHYVAPGLKREDGNVGFGAFPTVCRAIPRFSRPKIASGPPSRDLSRLCTSEYPRETIPSTES